jgi:hypothetical protein
MGARKFFVEWREHRDGAEVASARGRVDDEAGVARPDHFEVGMVEEPSQRRLFQEWPADLPPPKVGDTTPRGGVVVAVYERTAGGEDNKK